MLIAGGDSYCEMVFGSAGASRLFCAQRDAGGCALHPDSLSLRRGPLLESGQRFGGD